MLGGTLLLTATRLPPSRSFPYCHTGPAGNNADARPYNRLPGVGLDYPDPNLNANESVRKCNGVGATSVKAIQAIGPHTAPLGMVSRGRCCCWVPPEPVHARGRQALSLAHPLTRATLVPPAAPPAALLQVVHRRKLPQQF